MNLKGRENEFRNIAIELIRRFQNDVGEVLITSVSYYQRKLLFRWHFTNSAFFVFIWCSFCSLLLRRTKISEIEIYL